MSIFFSRLSCLSAAVVLGCAALSGCAADPASPTDGPVVATSSKLESSIAGSYWGTAASGTFQSLTLSPSLSPAADYDLFANVLTGLWCSEYYSVSLEGTATFKDGVLTIHATLTAPESAAADPDVVSFVKEGFTGPFDATLEGNTLTLVGADGAVHELMTEAL